MLHLKTGVLKDFKADAFVNVNHGHKLFLTLLCKKNPIQYHELMPGLYNAVGYVLFTSSISVSFMKSILKWLKREALCHPHCTVVPVGSEIQPLFLAYFSAIFS